MYYSLKHLQSNKQTYHIIIYENLTYFAPIDAIHWAYRFFTIIILTALGSQKNRSSRILQNVPIGNWGILVQTSTDYLEQPAGYREGARIYFSISKVTGCASSGTLSGCFRKHHQQGQAMGWHAMGPLGFKGWPLWEASLITSYTYFPEGTQILGY